MKLFAKPVFRWREPKELSKTLRNYGKSPRLWVVVPISLAITLWAWDYFQLPYDGSYIRALAIIILFLLFLCYGLPWLVKVAPTQIELHSKMLTAQSASSCNVAYSQVATFRAVEIEGHNVLVLVTKQEKEFKFGIAKDVDITALSDFLKSVGITETTS